MNTLVLGGIKSGKSRIAEELATASGQPVSLIATAIAKDAEMAARISHHRCSRPAHWQVVEEPVAVGRVLENLSTTDHCVILDCITLWLTNLLMSSDESMLTQEKKHLVESVKSFKGTLILVSNETSMGIVPIGELTRRYCDEVGMLHQILAQHCTKVILSVAGLPQIIKDT